ncbi:MAG: DNA polymerase III subunit delta' [Hyphomicrobiaceae bacterium]|nr:DNA polymerase III subunit delta' [Hyphomicrobiaceae bacterium]
MARAVSVTDAEILPEADRLEGVPHPRFTAKLRGHADAEATLAAGLVSGQLHHGWLVSGPAGIGKATLAWRFARAALSAADERDRTGRSLLVSSETRGSRQVRALSHPGLLLLRRPYNAKDKRFASSITIDEVRRLRQFLSLGAEEGLWRTVIIDTADDMNPNAANAVLKSLEEPPPRTVFMLLTSEPGRLLPTIRSRCRLLPLLPLADADLRAAVTDALEAEDATVPKESDWPALTRLSGGSVRRALALFVGGGIELDATISRQLADLPKVDWSSLHSLADKLAPATAEQQFELYFELLLASLARLVRTSAMGGAGGAATAGGSRLSSRLPETAIPRFAMAWETIARNKREADALNLDRKALILDTFATLEKAAR